MKINITLYAVAFSLIGHSYAAPLEVEPEVRKKTSHGLGYLQGRYFAKELLKAGFTPDDLHTDEVIKGFNEALKDQKSSIEGKDFRASLDIMKATLRQRETELAKVNLEKSKQWIEEQAKKSDVKSTKTGLLYKVITQGGGVSYHDFDDVDDSKVKFYISYEGRLTDGIIFEKVPEEKAIAVKLSGLPGVSEALKQMTTGSTWELYLKPELAYGSLRIGNKVEPNSAIFFKLTLIDIKTEN